MLIASTQSALLLWMFLIFILTYMKFIALFYNLPSMLGLSRRLGFNPSFKWSLFVTILCEWTYLQFFPYEHDPVSMMLRHKVSLGPLGFADVPDAGDFFVPNRENTLGLDRCVCCCDGCRFECSLSLSRSMLRERLDEDMVIFLLEDDIFLKVFKFLTFFFVFCLSSSLARRLIKCQAHTEQLEARSSHLGKTARYLKTDFKKH